MKLIAAYKSENSSDPTGLNILVWPDSVIVKSGKPVFVDEDMEQKFLSGFVAKITAVGKSVSKKFARRYYDEIAPAIFIVSEETMEKIERGEDPRACDIVADYSIICGDGVPADRLGEISAFGFKISDLGYSETGIEPVDIEIKAESVGEKINEAIVAASRRNTIKTGDMVGIFTGRVSDCRTEKLLQVEADGKRLIDNKIK